MNQQRRIGLVLLAAGESKRLGSPKQLIAFGGETLLRRAARAAANSGCAASAAVLGASAETLLNELDGSGLEIVINRDWQTGMGNSIRAGLRRLLEMEPGLEAVIITVCDQPGLTAAVIDGLIAKYAESEALIVASAYAGTIGVPALFDRPLFSDLLGLNEDRGAKSIIRKHPAETVAVAFPGGEIDIDTPEDLLGMNS